MAAIAALAIASPVLAGQSLKSLVKKEVAKQLAGKTGPAADFPAQAGLDADEVHVDTRAAGGILSDVRFNVQAF